MISVTRLNGRQFVLNAELIRTIEENPDTIITLISGEHLVVREDSKEIITSSEDLCSLLLIFAIEGGNPSQYIVDTAIDCKELRPKFCKD